MDFINHIISAVRSLPAKGRRNGIKILSLSLGLSVSLVLLTKVCFEKTFDKFFEGADRIFYVTETYNTNGEEQGYGSTSGGIAPRMKEHFPAVEVATRWTPITNDTKVILKEGDRKASVGRVILADTCFFRILDRQCLAGSLTEPLGMKGNAVVSSSLALRLSGSHDQLQAAQDILGKVFRLEDDVKGAEVVISGVFEDYPANSSLRPDVVVSLPSISMYGMYDGSDLLIGNDRYRTLIRLVDKNAAGQITDGMSAFINHYLPREDVLESGLKSFPVHPYSSYHDEVSNSRSMMLVLALVAMALLLTAVLNYILIVLSTSVNRSREMALRKCLGSDAADMYMMMSAESLVHTVLACLTAIVLIYASRGTIENLAGTAVSDLFRGTPLMVSVAVVVLVFLVNAIIPAAMYSRIPVATIFRNFVAGNRVWKRALLAVEFSAVAFLGVLLSIISLQYDKLVTTDLGFDCVNTAIVDINGMSPSQKKSLMDEILTIPDVADASFCNQSPFGSYSGNNVQLPGSSETLFNISDGYWNDSHWFDVMGVKIVKGHTFTEDKWYDEEVMIDTRFEEMLKTNTGWDDVIGKEIMVTEHTDGKLTSVITGVFEPITSGLFAGDEEFFETRPMAVFYLNPDITCNAFGHIIIKYHNLDSESLAKTQAVIERVVPDRTLEICPFKIQRLDAYKETLDIRNTILIGGIITLLIAIIGLIGYTIDEIKRRRKEIAVRRVNGAQFSEIRGMFLRDIMMIAVPSAIFGCVISGFAASRWEQQFLVKAGLPWWAFTVTFIATMVIVAVISDIYVLKIANSNPSESLKTE